MRTAKCLIGVLVLGIVTTALFAGQSGLSKTREANCLVRITADSDIVPLNLDTVIALVLSSAVAGEAVPDVLGRDLKAEDRRMITVEWLSQDARRADAQRGLLGTPESYKAQMMGELLDEMRGMDEYDEMEPGTGGYGDDMMGGMFRGRAPAQVPAGQQRVTVQLSVHLPDDAKPAAEELLDALVANLRAVLADAYEEHAEQLRNLQRFAESQREYAANRLLEAMGLSPQGRSRIEDQLDTYVDLSSLTREMSAEESIDLLRNAVEPPLNIMVLWNDVQVEPSTSINIEGLSTVKLRTALEVIVKGLTHLRNLLTYAIHDDVIVIGSQENVSRSTRIEQPLKVESDNRALAGQSSALSRQSQALELELAGLDARRRAIQQQIARAEDEVNRTLAEDNVMRELQKLIEMATTHVENLRRMRDSGRASNAELSQATESLTRARIDLARRREELGKSAGGLQLEKLNADLTQIAIDMAERQAQWEGLRQQLDQVQQELAQASAFSPAAAKIRMAREVLDITERRMATIQTELMKLEPPAVVVIGAN